MAMEPTTRGDTRRGALKREIQGGQISENAKRNVLTVIERQFRRNSIDITW